MNKKIKNLIFAIILIFITFTLISCNDEKVMSGKDILSNYNKDNDHNDTKKEKINESDIDTDSNDYQNEEIDYNDYVNDIINDIIYYNSDETLLERFLSYQIVFSGKNIDGDMVVYMEGYNDRQGGKLYRVMTPEYNNDYTLSNLPYYVTINNETYTMVEGKDSSPLKNKLLYNNAMKDGKDIINTLLGRDTLININFNNYIIENVSENRNKLSYTIASKDEETINSKYSKINNIKEYTYDVYFDNKNIIDEVDVFAVTKDGYIYDYYIMKILHDVNVPTAIKTVRNESNGEMVYYNYLDIENRNTFTNYKKYINSILINRECHISGIFDAKNWNIWYYYDTDGNIVVKDEAIDSKDPLYYIKYDGRWYEYRDSENIKKCSKNLKKYEKDPILYTVGYKSLFDHNINVVTSHEIGDNQAIIIQEENNKNKTNRIETIIDLDEYQVKSINEYLDFTNDSSAKNSKNADNTINFELDVNEPPELEEVMFYVDELIDEGTY